MEYGIQTMQYSPSDLIFEVVSSLILNERFHPMK